jgi:hypothetical protein
VIIQAAGVADPTDVSQPVDFGRLMETLDSGEAGGEGEAQVGRTVVTIMLVLMKMTMMFTVKCAHILLPCG